MELNPYNLTQSQHEANKAPQMAALSTAMRVLCDALPHASGDNYSPNSRTALLQKMSQMADEICRISTTLYTPPRVQITGEPAQA